MRDRTWISKAIDSIIDDDFDKAVEVIQKYLDGEEHQEVLKQPDSVRADLLAGLIVSVQNRTAQEVREELTKTWVEERDQLIDSITKFLAERFPEK